MKTAKRSRLTARSPRVRKVLKSVFGFKKLRDAQEDVIDSVFTGRNTLAILPTGAGKSLCYQLPGQLLVGTTVVVSPLIALMKDQNDKLHELGLESVELNSTLSAGAEKSSLRALKKGATEYLYVTPERLLQPDFLKSLKKLKIDLFVVDEAHCLSQWGHDFRPAFLGMVDAWKQLGSPQLLALTATATEQVAEEIATLFDPDLNVIRSGVFRENLCYQAQVLDKEDEKIPRVIELLGEGTEPTVIYSATVAAVESLFESLQEAGFKVGKYHGKMKAADRHQSQDEFMSGRTPIMIATNAFGMGIDKPDIRSVIHYHFAGSLEAYYQESGRAGRDGFSSTCSLLYLKKDKATQSFFLAGKYPMPDSILAVYKAIEAGEEVTAKELQETLKSIPVTKMKVILSALRNAEIVELKARGKMRVLRTGLELEDLKSVFDVYQAKKENDREKLKQMIVYAQSAMCRWKILMNYFKQETSWAECGHCDNCVRNAERTASSASGSNKISSETSATVSESSQIVTRNETALVEGYA